MSENSGTERMIVASRHLASGDGGPLSEFEFSLTVLNNAYQKWIVRCAAATMGQHDLSPIDVLVLHNINHRDTEKRRIDVCFMLNIEDTHTVNYALKKLIKLGLAKGRKKGKEIFYSLTRKGINVCDEYRIIRDRCLISSLKSLDHEASELHAMAEKMRTLSGLYDQASRAAASF